MFKSMLGFITGVILLYFSADLINSSKETLNYYAYFKIALISLGLYLLFLGITLKQTQFRELSLYLLAIVLGFSYASFTAERIINSRISSSFDQQIIQVSAFLCGLPKRGEYSYSADFCLLNVQSKEGVSLAGQGFKARLRWPLDVDYAKGLNVLDVKSRQTKATKNFIGVSFESNLFYERIILKGEVKQHIHSIDLDSLSSLQRLKYEYHQFRNDLSHRIKASLDGSMHKGIINALLLGDRSTLSPEDIKVLANTGTQHLIAISGLHVGLVMFGLFYLLPRSALSILLVSVFGLFYVILVGFTPSAQRAWIMCVCGLLYFSGYIKQSKWLVLVFALFLILVFDPLAPLNLGFWYSFLCIAIIFLISHFTSFDPKYWYSLFALQLLLIIAMVPVSSILGSRHGFENILANLFAIPWVSLVVLPLCLFWFVINFFSGEFSFYVLSVLDVLIEFLTSFLASLVVFNIPISMDTNFLAISCFVIGFIALLVFNKIKSLVLICLIALSLAIYFPSRFYERRSELMVFDVGQGLALAIKSEDRLWLYDTGPAFEKSSSTRNVILPYLRQHRKSNKLEGLIVSHGDSDHAGDLVSLYDEFSPGLAWSGQSERLYIKGFESCEAGMNWQEGSFLIEVLYPYPDVDISQRSSNNHSCVIRLRLEGKVFLLMGDVEAEAEMGLVKRYRDELKADVLIAGHHGASKSSSFALLKHVQPEYIVFSAGYLNKFNHPSDIVLERVSSFKTVSLNTSQLGAIKFNVDSEDENILISHAR